MKFNLSAAKAYIGGLAAAALVQAAPGIVSFIDGLVNAALGFHLPAGAQTLLLSAVAYLVTHVAVYLMPNKTAQPPGA